MDDAVPDQALHRVVEQLEQVFRLVAGQRDDPAGAVSAKCLHLSLVELEQRSY